MFEWKALQVIDSYLATEERNDFGKSIVWLVGFVLKEGNSSAVPLTAEELLKFWTTRKRS